MPSSKDKSQLNYSNNLFTINDSPMVFYVYPSSDYNDIVHLIQEGGGLVVNDVDDKNLETIYLSSNTKNLGNRTNCICTSFIYACCLTNKIRDLDEFRLQLAPNCCSRIPCEKVDRGNALGECMVRKRTLSNVFIRTTMQYIFLAESAWKTMAESKKFGDMSWRDIRREFHLWAFLQSEPPAPKDSIFVRDDKCSCTKMTNESSNGIETKKDFVAVYAERVSEENKNIEMEEDVTQTNLENRVLETVTEDVEKTSDDHQSSCKIKVEGKSCNVASAKMLTELKIDEVMREKVSQSKLMIVIESGNDVSDDVSEDSAKLSYEMKAKEKASAVVCAERSTEDSRCEEMREDVTQSHLENSILVMAGNPRENIIGGVSKPKGWTCSETCENNFEDMTTDEDTPQNRVTMDVTYENVCSDFPQQTPNPLSEIMDKSSTRGCIESSSEESIDDEDIAVSKRRKRKPVRLYTLKEDLEILRYVINRRKRIGTLAGNRIWKFMEKRNIVQDRTWQSLKERFKRHIMPNISSYPLSSEDRRKLKNELCESREK